MNEYSSNTKVKVAVRCRPLMGRELMLGRKCLNIVQDAIIVGAKRFAFESVFPEDASQLEVYESCVGSLIEGCFSGYNATVFAYGQTGSGKSHSMGMLATDDEEEEGIIPRAIRDIFTTIKKERSLGKAASVKVSMIEIYNDDCRDLLHPDIPPKDIMIREDRDGRIFFTGAREEAVHDVKTAVYYLEQGNLNRSTAETLMNQSSSRSHAVYTVSLEVLEYKENQGRSEYTITNSTTSGPAGCYTQAKLHLVDLAGSERAKRTGALGTRLKESVGINQVGFSNTQIHQLVHLSL